MNPKHFSRRDFVKTASLVTAGLGLNLNLKGCTSSKERRLSEIGLQVSTIRAELAKDWQAVLKQVAEIGYNTLELGGTYGDLSIPEFKDFLSGIGLVPLAGGAAMSGLQQSLSEVIDSSLAMGKKYVICYWPWTDSAENKTLDDWKMVAEKLNQIGEQVIKAGLEFTYHNHDIEFKITEDQIPYNLLLDQTDPELVGMEIDLYWNEKGNQKPIPYFEQYPGRFPLWHVKDMENTPERSFACVGEGIIDFPAIFAKADLAGMKHIFVEHDRPENPMECARVSYQYLNQLRY